MKINMRNLSGDSRGQKRRRLLRRGAAALALALVLGTCGGLAAPAHAASAICGQEEHSHSESCYSSVLTCSNGDEEHVHDSGCYTKKLTCGKSEHSHSSACYPVETAAPTAEPAPAEPTPDTKPTAEAPADPTPTAQEDVGEPAAEHTPTAGPTEDVEQPAESEAPAGPTPEATEPAETEAPAEGGEATAEPSATPAVPKLTVHVSAGSRSCFGGESVHFSISSSGGQEPVTCSVRVLQGGSLLYEGNSASDVTVTTKKTGVVSTVSINVTVTDALGTTAAASTRIPCAAKKVESTSKWDKSVYGAKRTGDWPADLIAVAKTQLGYHESVVNFIVNEDGKRQGYTRYGHFMGMPYEEWCAMYVSFCLNYARVPSYEFPREASNVRWLRLLKNRGLFALPSSAEPRPGDLVFFDWERDGAVDHVGIVSEVIETESGIRLKTIEGNHSKSVAEVGYSLKDRSICGYGLVNKAYESYLATQACEFTYEGFGLTAKATCTGLARIPADAEMTVQEVRPGEGRYAAYTEAVRQALCEDGAKEIVEAHFYTIGFAADGEPVEAQTPVKLELTYAAGLSVAADADVRLVAVNSGDELAQPDFAAAFADGAVKTISFTAENKAVYGFVVIAPVPEEAPEAAEAEEIAEPENDAEEPAPEETPVEASEAETEPVAEAEPEAAESPETAGPAEIPEAEPEPIVEEETPDEPEVDESLPQDDLL